MDRIDIYRSAALLIKRYGEDAAARPAGNVAGLPSSIKLKNPGNVRLEITVGESN